MLAVEIRNPKIEIRNKSQMRNSVLPRFLGFVSGIRKNSGSGNGILANSATFLEVLKFECSKTNHDARFWISLFDNWHLFRISDFEFRIYYGLHRIIRTLLEF